MAQLVLTNASITINAVDLSSRSNKVSINYEVESVEVTSFNSAGTRTYSAGMNNTTVDIDLIQDFAAANVEATIYPLVGTTTTVIIKPTSSAVGATNPTYTIAGAFLAKHTPVAGGVGSVAMTSLSFQGGTITKATS